MEPYVTSRERYFRILDSKKGALGIVDVHVQSRTFQLGNNRDIIKAVIYKWANFPVHALLGRGQLADAYMRIDVRPLQLCNIDPDVALACYRATCTHPLQLRF